MCGIVGLGCFTTGGIWFNQVTQFRQMLITDSLRGIDGAGIVRVKKDGVADWRKVKGSGFDLLRCKDVNPWLEDSSKDCDKILIGHNRAASVGNKTNDNAHPFEHEHITLVHNGFISNLHDFGKKANKLEVDSDGLAFAIAKRGIMPVLEKLRGAYSLAIFDAKEKTLNLVRNKDRPLFFGFDEARKMLIFASEKPMIEWILDRTNSKTDYGQLIELPDHQLMTVTLDGAITKQDYTPPVYVYQQSGYIGGGWDGDKDDEAMAFAWGRVPQTTVDKPPYTALPPPTMATNVANLYKGKGGKAYDFPEQLYGYKKGDKIQFVGMDKEKVSSTQDQWKVIGSHTTHENLEIHCFVKGEQVANVLVDEATMVEGIIRSLERRDNGSPQGLPIIFVTDPVPLYGEQGDLKTESNVVVSIDSAVTKH